MKQITGTLIWYYYICPREVWLMSHELNPNQEDSFLEIGRLLQEDSYKREKKEIAVGNMKIDLIRKGNGRLIIGEVKKSSHFENSARMQLAFYLYRLKRYGVKAEGELLIPKEKKRISVRLTSNLTKREWKRMSPEDKKSSTPYYWREIYIREKKERQRMTWKW